MAEGHPPQAPKAGRKKFPGVRNNPNRVYVYFIIITPRVTAITRYPIASTKARASSRKVRVIIEVLILIVTGIEPNQYRTIVITSRRRGLEYLESLETLSVRRVATT